MSSPILLQQLRAASTADEVIQTLQEIVDLDEGNTYRAQETVDLLDPASPLRAIIESNKTNDVLITAIGSFFLWFVPQKIQENREFKHGRDLCTRNNQIAEFYINTLLPNAQSNASIYSVCRGVCRIVCHNNQAQCFFSTHDAVQAITNVILRASDARSCLWSVAIIRDVCTDSHAPRVAFAKSEVVGAILHVFSQNGSATATIECAFAALRILQVENRDVWNILRSDPSYALRMILDGLPKVSTEDGMSWACSTLAKMIQETNENFATTLQTKEVAMVLFCARKCFKRTLEVVRLMDTLIPSSRRVDGALKIFAEVEDEILGDEISERKVLRKCATREDLVRMIWSEQFTARLTNLRTSLSKVRIFNNSSVLIEKIEYFLHLPENTDREEDQKQQFICDVARWFDANFFVPDNSNSIAVDCEKLFDFFFHTLLSNSSFHLPKQATDTSSAEIVLELLDGKMSGYVQQNNVAGAGQSWMAAVEQVLGLIQDAADEGNRPTRQRFVRRLSLGLSLILKLCSKKTDGHLCADKAQFLVDSGRISKFLIKQTEIASEMGFCLRSENI